MIRAIVADDHPIVTEGLKALFAQFPHAQFHIIATVRNGKDAIDAVRTHNPDILLLDLNMPEIDGFQVLEALIQHQTTRKLIITEYDDPRMVKQVFQLKADGYLLKNSSPEDYFEAVQEVLQGNTWLGKGVQFAPRKENVPTMSPKFRDLFLIKFGLTSRELDVLRLICEANTTREIANKLFISEQTVGVHRKSIMRKIGTTNAPALIKMVYDEHLL